MNILQSFMGCMYPGSIRTESIESMDNEYPDCRFQVANIDDRGNIVSKGELQLTDNDLIYFRPSKFPTRWPLGYIRRYGCSEDKSVFTFESGRRCSTGQAIFAFHCSRATDLLDKLKEKIDRFPSTKTSNESFIQDNILMDYRFNRRDSCHQSPNNLKNFQSLNQESTDQRKQFRKDASTSTDNNVISTPELLERMSYENQDADPRPLSYALIDFDTTKALNDSAQAHAASRVR